MRIRSLCVQITRSEAAVVDPLWLVIQWITPEQCCYEAPPGSVLDSRAGPLLPPFSKIYLDLFLHLRIIRGCPGHMALGCWDERRVIDPCLRTKSVLEQSWCDWVVHQRYPIFLHVECSTIRHVWIVSIYHHRPRRPGLRNESENWM